MLISIINLNKLRKIILKRPIAIGAMGCNFADIKTNNLQGVAVYVLHMLDDKLWFI